MWTTDAKTVSGAAVIIVVMPLMKRSRTLAFSRNPFLGGPKPNYADYIAFGLFQWVVGVNTLPPLAKDDSSLQLLALHRRLSFELLRWNGSGIVHSA